MEGSSPCEAEDICLERSALSICRFAPGEGYTRGQRAFWMHSQPSSLAPLGAGKAFPEVETGRGSMQVPNLHRWGRNGALPEAEDKSQPGLVL